MLTVHQVFDLVSQEVEKRNASEKGRVWFSYRIYEDKEKPGQIEVRLYGFRQGYKLKECPICLSQTHEVTAGASKTHVDTAVDLLARSLGVADDQGFYMTPDGVTHNNNPKVEKELHA